MIAFAILAAAIAATPGTPAERALFGTPSMEPVFLEKARLAPGAIPKRIVTVAPSVTELIYALGAGDRVVGVSRYDDYPPEVAALPKVGGFLDPNLEVIVALAPDLVVGVPNANNRPILERIARLGTPVLIVPGNAMADIVSAARALAPVLGKDAPERAQKMIDGLVDELTVLSNRVAKKKPPRVAFVYGGSPLILAGPGSFADTLLALVNAKNIAVAGGSYPQYSVEKLIEDAPEVIVDASELHGMKQEAPWSRFDAIPAVKNKRVHVVPQGDLLRPGPRIGQGLRQLVALIHQEK